jgi:hypothetical protein
MTKDEILLMTLVLVRMHGLFFRVRLPCLTAWPIVDIVETRRIDP